MKFMIFDLQQLLFQFLFAGIPCFFLASSLVRRTLNLFDFVITILQTARKNELNNNTYLDIITCILSETERTISIFGHETGPESSVIYHWYYCCYSYYYYLRVADVRADSEKSLANTRDTKYEQTYYLHILYNITQYIIYCTSTYTAVPTIYVYCSKFGMQLVFFKLIFEGSPMTQFSNVFNFFFNIFKRVIP